MAVLIVGSISPAQGWPGISPGNEPVGVTVTVFIPRVRARGRQDMASFDDGPLLSPVGYLYSVFHQSGAGRKVRVVDIVVVDRAVGVDVVRVIGVGVRGAQAPVDGGAKQAIP